jgi:hypothetical protein
LSKHAFLGPAAGSTGQFIAPDPIPRSGRSNAKAKPDSPGQPMRNVDSAAGSIPRRARIPSGFPMYILPGENPEWSHFSEQARGMSRVREASQDEAGGI